MKGIILAGGSGSRLAPLTNVISKQLLPVYDKPMICYPLATLMNLNIKEILVISTPFDTPHIERFLGDGSDFGIKIEYKVQEKPNGIAEAFIVGEEFIGDDAVCLILGDNIFYGSGISTNNFYGSGVSTNNLQERFAEVESGKFGAQVFAYQVSDPARYGVIEFDKDTNLAISVEEKPENPKSNWALTGLYVYNNEVVNIAKNLQPSARGELEITDVNKKYLDDDKLGVIKLGRGFAWLDAGTPDSLLDSACFIQTIEKRQGLKIACLEEGAYRNGFIDAVKLQELTQRYKKGSEYRNYLNKILTDAA